MGLQSTVPVPSSARGQVSLHTVPSETDFILNWVCRANV